MNTCLIYSFYFQTMEGRSDRGNTPEDIRPATSPERMEARGVTPSLDRSAAPREPVSPAANMEMMILSAVGGESGSSTPENWQQHYAAYLEDSPITPQLKPIAREQNPSPKRQDKVDQQLEKMKLRAEYFFRRTATLNITTEAEEQRAMDRRAKVEEIVQWARLQTLEGKLVNARDLFNKLGTTNPSLEVSVFAELVMEQYHLAKNQGKESWLGEARQMAIMFFPTNWVDSHLQRWTKGRPLVTRRHQPSSLTPSTTSMAKDRRVTIDKQSLPCVRSDAAASDDRGSVTVGWSSENREESRATDHPTKRDHSRGTPRPGHAKERSKEHSASYVNRGKPRLSDSHQNRRGQVSKSSHRSHSPQSSRQDYRPSSRQHSVSFSSRKRSSTEGPSSSGVKKYRNSMSHQVCPVTGCGEVTKYLKDHVQQRHLPSLFHQLDQNDRGLSNTHRQRLNGLEQLAAGLLGPNSSSLDLLDYVNSRLQDIIHAPTNIWGPLQGEMRALCKFARWSVPEKFEVFPRVNSPAALIYWRILVSLLGQLTDVERTEFYSTYNLEGGSGETLPKTSSGAVLHEGRSSSRTIHSREELSQTGEFLREVEDLAREVEEQVPQDRRRSINADSSHLTVTIGEPKNSTQRDESSYPTSPWAAFDSHFHLDRTARKLWGLDEVSTVTIDDVLGYALPQPPLIPVNLVGGVMVFCDPETRLSIPLMDGRWKIAVGLHPKKVPNCSEAYLEQIKTLLHSNPLVVALGEIGLDRTVPDYLWDDQDLVFRRMLTFCHPDKVLVLHLRGSSTIHSSDVVMAALQYVRKACSQDQKIHLHCFTGQASDVESWTEDFPNCYFGFTTRVTSFNGRQQEAVRVVPWNRLLIETDSPYMPGSGNEVNTPAYLGDVARAVAQCRGISIEELLAVTTTNGQRLYQ